MIEQSSTSRMEEVQIPQMNFQKQSPRQRQIKSFISVLGFIGLVVALFECTFLTFQVYDLRAELNTLRTSLPTQTNIQNLKISILRQLDIDGKIDSGINMAVANTVDYAVKVAISKTLDSAVKIAADNVAINIQKKYTFDSDQIQSKVILLQNQVNDLEILTNFLEQKLKQDYHYKKMEKFKEIMAKSPITDENVRNPINLARTNIDLPYSDILIERNMTAELEKEYKRLNEKYQIEKYTNEVPLCVYIPTYNNVKNWRYLYNLHGVLTQNYTNYRVLVINDASTDLTTFMLKRYLKKHNIGEDKVKLITNSIRKTAVVNHYYAAHQFCKPGQKMIILDGDDELIGKQVFKTVSAAYQSSDSVIVYSNYVGYLIYQDHMGKGTSAAYLYQIRLNRTCIDSVNQIFGIQEHSMWNFLERSKQKISKIKMEISLQSLTKLTYYRWLRCLAAK